MRFLSIVLAFCLIACLLTVCPSEANSQEAWADKTTPAPTVEVAEGDTFKLLAARPGPTRKERRAMGITLRNIRLKLKEMRAAGELEDVDQSEVAAMVLDRLLAENPKAFAAANPTGDDAFFERLLAFIERILPLILRIMALFGA